MIVKRPRPLRSSKSYNKYDNYDKELYIVFFYPQF